MELILPPNGTRHDGASRFYVFGWESGREAA